MLPPKCRAISGPKASRASSLRQRWFSSCSDKKILSHILRKLELFLTASERSSGRNDRQIAARSRASLYLSSFVNVASSRADLVTLFVATLNLQFCRATATTRQRSASEIEVFSAISRSRSELLSPLASAKPCDLPPGRPSFITRVLGVDSGRFRVGQARRARSPQIAQAPGALLLAFGCPVRNVA